MLTAVLDAGAEEVNDLGESFEVVSEPADLVATRTALQEAGIDYDSADVAFLPSVEIDLDEEQAKRVFRLIEALEDSDDVQDVYANYSVSDEIMEKLEADAGRYPARPAPAVRWLPVADQPDATPVLIRAVRPDDDLDAELDLAERSFGPTARPSVTSGGGRSRT